VKYEHVEEVHSPEDKKDDTEPRDGLLDHVGEGPRRTTGVDQKGRSAQVDEVEADDKQTVHRVGEALLLEDRDQKEAAIAVESGAHPHRKKNAGDEIQEVVDQPKVHRISPKNSQVERVQVRL
jgi:hypothetical protein